MEGVGWGWGTFEHIAGCVCIDVCVILTNGSKKWSFVVG